MERNAKKREKKGLESGVDLKLSNSDVLAYAVSSNDEDGKFSFHWVFFLQKKFLWSC